jgi:hypothetical protein
MKSGVKVFQCQKKAPGMKKDFNFKQNIWTMEVTANYKGVELTNLYDGVFKAVPGVATQPSDLLRDIPEEWRGDVPSTIKKNDDNCDDTNAIKSLFTGGGCPAPYPGMKGVRKIFITRHANSCNNIVPQSKFYEKVADPSISSFGEWTLNARLPAQLQKLKRQRRNEDVVFVTCCVRTWMTAILIYGTGSNADTYSDKKTLNLVVAPYLKEAGSDPGNMPESIDKQVAKIATWIKKRIYADAAPRDIKLPIRSNVTIFVANMDGTKVQIYPDKYPVSYLREHTTFYPDGVQRFCQWVNETDKTSPLDKPLLETETFVSPDPLLETETFVSPDVTFGGFNASSSSFSRGRKRYSRRAFPRGSISRRVRRR